MTGYGFPPADRAYSQRVAERKAKRQAVLTRVRAQRAKVYKRTVAEWMQVGAIIRGSELKQQYQNGALQELPWTPLDVGTHHGLNRRYPSRSSVRRWNRRTTFRMP
jgi:hypothetical protein